MTSAKEIIEGFEKDEIEVIQVLRKFPVPWSIVKELDGKSYSVKDALGNTIYFKGTYTGDGDEEILLTKDDWAEIVKIVNREGQA